MLLKFLCLPGAIRQASNGCINTELGMMPITQVIDCIKEYALIGGELLLRRISGGEHASRRGLPTLDNFLNPQMHVIV